MQQEGRTATEGAREPIVLLVEDDESVRRSLKLLLCSRGYGVRDYGSATELLADPDGHSGICLVTDYVMPEMDGLSLLARLRASGWDGPAILITGLYNGSLPARAAAAGFSLLLEKPLTDRAMLTAVRQLMAAPCR